MNPTKKRILHELGLRKAQEDYKNSLSAPKIQMNEIRSEAQRIFTEVAKNNKQSDEVILNEYN